MKPRFPLLLLLGLLAWAPLASGQVVWRVSVKVFVDVNGNRPANLPRSRQYNDSPELSTITSDSLLLDAQTKLAPDWTLKGRIVSMRAKTHEVDVWPYRANLIGLDTCDNSAGLTSLCRYYFYVRPEGKTKLDQVTVDLIGDVQLGGLQHKLLAEIDLDVEIEEAAASLGANRWHTVFRVILPSLIPALLTGFALAFARAIGEYGSVIFIAGNLPNVSEIAPLLIVIRLSEFRYADATAIACGLVWSVMAALISTGAVMRVVTCPATT